MTSSISDSKNTISFTGNSIITGMNFMLLLCTVSEKNVPLSIKTKLSDSGRRNYKKNRFISISL
jgi:hypothetical protein